MLNALKIPTIALFVLINMRLIRINSVSSVQILKAMIIHTLLNQNYLEEVLAQRFVVMDSIMGIMNAMMETTEMEMAAHLNAK